MIPLMTATGVANSLEARVEQPDLLQRAEHESLVGEDELPADGADDEAGEEREDHQQQQDRL